MSAPLGSPPPSSSPPSPWAAPRDARDARPAVILWFRVYAAMMTVAMSAVLLVAIFVSSAGGDAAYVMVGASAPLVPLFAVATFVPFKPWGWTLALGAIAIGMMSGAIVFALPLMIFWFRPTVKAAFARL